MEGRRVGSNEYNIKGQATYQWLPGGFFLEQRVHLDFMGMEINSLELVRYDPETGAFPSTVYSNLSPMPFPYRLEVDEGALKISVSYGPLDATFRGQFSDDGNSFSGGWHPAGQRKTKHEGILWLVWKGSVPNNYRGDREVEVRDTLGKIGDYWTIN